MTQKQESDSDNQPKQVSTTVSWLLKNVLVPLSPSLLGALIRWSITNKFGWHLLSSSEVLCSLAMIFFVIMIGARSVQGDSSLYSSLTNLSLIGLFVCIGFFSTTTYQQEQLNKETNDVRDYVVDSIKRQNVSGKIEYKLDNIKEIEGQSNRIRYVVLPFSIVVIIIGLFLRRQYKLVD